MRGAYRCLEALAPRARGPQGARRDPTLGAVCAGRYFRTMPHHPSYLLLKKTSTHMCRRLFNATHQLDAGCATVNTAPASATKHRSHYSLPLDVPS